MIYTIGHSNHTIEKFLDLLKAYGVEVVIELRTVPKSQYAPHFDRVRLVKNLSERGIRYQDMGETIGGRPKDRTVLTPAGKIDQGKIEKRQWYQDAIGAIVELSRCSRVALLCSEEDPSRCHRGYVISHTLLDRGEEVIHIRGDGNSQKATHFVVQGELF